MLAAVWDTEGMAVRILIGDALERLRDLPAASVQCAVTSPPYWRQRDYGVAGQIGPELTGAVTNAKVVMRVYDLRHLLFPPGTVARVSPPAAGRRPPWPAK